MFPQHDARVLIVGGGATGGGLAMIWHCADYASLWSNAVN